MDDMLGGATNYTDVSFETETRLVDLYLAWCLGRGASRETIKLRRTYLKQLPSPLTATTDDLMLWMAGHPNWAQSTRATVVAVLRGFYRWLRRRGERSDDPTEDIGRVRVPKRVPRAVPAAVVDEALLTGTDRARLMVALGAWSVFPLEGGSAEKPAPW